jgi:hypothetical protein
VRRLLLPLVAVLLLAACGGSSGGSLSHAELVKRADAICADAHAASSKVPPATDLTSAVPTLNKGLAIGRRELTDLRALEPSKADAAGYAAVVAGLRTTIDTTVRARDALKADQRVRAQLLIQTALRSASQTRATAAGFGLEVCSQDAAG